MAKHDNIAEVTVCSVCLFFLMFGMSATVSFETVVQQFRNRRAILSGLLMQFIIMPLLGLMAVKTLESYISPSVGITLLVVTSSPGGSYSNWFCSMFNADLALSVTMTALSTLLSAIFLPANLLLYAHLTYGNDGELLEIIDWGALFISLGVVLSSILAGLYASYRIQSRKFRRWCNIFGTASGFVLIGFSMFLSSNNNSTSVWNLHWSFYVCVAMPCLLGLVLSNVFGRMAQLAPPERVTLAVECCYQNVGIATTVAVVMFKENEIQRGEALCVPLFYGFVEAFVLGIYCIAAWKMGWTKAPKDEKFCVMLGKSYEIADEEDAEKQGEEDTTKERITEEDKDKNGADDETMLTSLSRSNSNDSSCPGTPCRSIINDQSCSDTPSSIGSNDSSCTNTPVPGRVRADTDEEEAIRDELENLGCCTCTTATSTIPTSINSPISVKSLLSGSIRYGTDDNVNTEI